MPIPLSAEEKEEIFLNIRKAFSDFRYFNLIEEPLRRLIHDCTEVYDIDYDKTRNVLDLYIADKNSYTTKDQQEILTKFRHILTAAYILIYSRKPEMDALKYHSVDEMLIHYPEKLFTDLKYSVVPDDQKELNYLLYFRNYMAIALKIVAAKSNKLFLLKVLERLEGSNNEYITGSGQKPSTTRRLDIYAKESSIAGICYNTGTKPNNTPKKPAMPSAFSSSSVVTTAPLSTGEDKNHLWKKRKLEEDNLPLSQESTSSNGIRDDVFKRSHTFQVLQSKPNNGSDSKVENQGQNKDDPLREAHAAGLPVSRGNTVVAGDDSGRAEDGGLTRLNTLFRMVSADPMFDIDEEAQKKLLEEPYSQSFTQTIKSQILKEEK
jgi:hypothetical protein